MMNNILSEKDIEQVTGGILSSQTESINKVLKRSTQELFTVLDRKYKATNKEVVQTAFVFVLVLTIQNFNITVREAYNTLAEVMNSSGLLTDPEVKAPWDRIVTCMEVVYK